MHLLSLSLGAVLAFFIPPQLPPQPPARSPEQLAALLVRYDHASPDEQRTLEPQIDAMAGQRYATVSRLFWYTELDEAKAAAHRLHRPILSLRMLGDLREDLSCANSRLFRATLYANAQVAALLRDQFVLYWSSERPVPKVTIDFGDGRKIIRTITGNSAHYVLDADGRVLDVLPGAYIPDVFRAELTRSLALARKVAPLSAVARKRALIAYHRAAADEAAAQWQRNAPGARYVENARYLQDESDLARAQRATVTKARMEVPALRTIGLLGPGDISPDEPWKWAAIGIKLWNLLPPAANHMPPQGVNLLDAPSRALVSRLRPTASEGPSLDSVLDSLQFHLVADSVVNELRLRPAIHRHLAETGDTDFASVNDWIYAQVFGTPKSDPWLGLNARTDFTGLPGDGVVVP